jgi:hypothetical protein
MIVDSGRPVLFPKKARQRLGRRRSPYLILFEVREADRHVEILRFWHAARGEHF